MSAGSKEIILAAAKRAAMAHGYTGLNFRDIAAEVGIKAPSIYHHFPTKADLGAAVAKRYWEDIVVDLKAISDQSPDSAPRRRVSPVEEGSTQRVVDCSGS
jgi:TetR/AcrR family transcriptional repressor of nem operon